MQELVKQLNGLMEKIVQATKRLDIESDERLILELELQASAPDFWNDPAEAAQVSQQLASLKRHVDDWRSLEREVAEALELARLAETDEHLQDEVKELFERTSDQYAKREFELKLSGPYDKNSAILSIYAGTGGTDAQDWAQMLLRMYLRYAEAAQFKAEVLDQSPGEEAGIKSVTVEISGPFAYGKLRSERGVHRLVRLSPFNSDNLRQTSFALVDVVPELEPAQELEIDPKELRVDVYRAGGHGGQSVNTTDSAVRITHLPTGLVVSIQNERSQLQNKAKAMAVLQARLAALMLEQHKAAVSEIRGDTQAAAWGNQIRSYVLHPYTKVKDHRTGVETAAAQSVLDGALDQFIEGYLQQQIGTTNN